VGLQYNSELHSITTLTITTGCQDGGRSSGERLLIKHIWKRVLLPSFVSRFR